jgi:hypothetical protein
MITQTIGKTMNLDTLPSWLVEATNAHRSTIEQHNAQGIRSILVLNVSTNECASYINTDDHTVPTKDDTFGWDVSHIWNRYDMTQAIPIIAVDLTQPLTGVLVGRLPWVTKERQIPVCGYCGTTEGPCAGTSSPSPRTC